MSITVQNGKKNGSFNIKLKSPIHQQPMYGFLDAGLFPQSLEDN
jgi:hypothetical protein